MSLYRIARTIRHLPVLNRAEWLWNRLRRPFHFLINRHGRGVRIMVGGICPARLPPDFCGGDWHAYEPETIAALIDWLRHHPSGLVIDIGCSVGIMAAVTLFSSAQAEVLAIDGDLASLKMTERMCQYTDTTRLHTLHGLISAEHASGLTLDSAVRETSRNLSASGLTGASGTGAYRCIGDGDDLPTHSLDELWDADAERRFAGREVLIKCDVEGAELLVLQGASRFLARFSPTLLLSVHPPALPRYGHSVAMLRDFLIQAGYQWKVLAVDHEEHWLCTRQAS